jgi:enterochelin esterase family protein
VGTIDRLETDPGFWTDLAAEGLPMVEPWDDDHVLVPFLWRGDADRTVYYFDHGDGTGGDGGPMPRRSAGGKSVALTGSAS